MRQTVESIFDTLKGQLAWSNMVDGPSPESAPRRPAHARRGASGREPEDPGGDDQRPVGALQGRANSINRLQVCLRRLLDAREIMVVSEVDNPVGRGRAGAQAVGIVETAAVHIGSQASDRCRRSVRASKAENLMPGVEELLDDGRPDPPGRSGDKDTHEDPPHR